MASEQRGLRSGIRVPVVDDQEIILELTARMLAQLGIASATAANGEEAKAVLEAGDHVDCVLSDVSMPRMDGIALAQWIRTAMPGLPVLLMTGADAEAAAASSGLRVLAKPVAIDALAAALADALLGDRTLPTGGAGRR